MKRLVPIRCLLLLLAAAAATAAEPAPGQDGIGKSVVRIVNYAQRGNWYTPWDTPEITERSGSGFVVDGGLVMTNAHVVSDARLLLLFLDNDPTPHEAELVHVAHDCDLALIRPLDTTLLRQVPPMRIGDLPRLRSTVETFGYPAGGTQLSSTRGVVSRIEEQVFMHSGIDGHLTIQTDAAINPGNSGGPVVQDGHLAGVAFQAAEGLENVGYVIPTEIVRRFLRDASDGRYDGYPDLGIHAAGLDNPAARRKARMADGETGVRVDMVRPGSSSDGAIREGDVLLEVEGRPVANDGSVADGEIRIPFGLLVDRRLVGETIRVRLLRNAARVEVPVTLSRYAPLQRRAHAYDVLPRYYVYAGLVFVPLELETLKTYGDDWATKADKLLLDAFYQRPMREPGILLKETVVLLRRLDHPINGHVAWYLYQVVDKVNGHAIDGLEDLIRQVETNQGDFQVFELAHHRRLCVIDRKAADAANAEILERYGIKEDRRL